MSSEKQAEGDEASSLSSLISGQGASVNIHNSEVNIVARLIRNEPGEPYLGAVGGPTQADSTKSQQIEGSVLSIESVDKADQRASREFGDIEQKAIQKGSPSQKTEEIGVIREGVDAVNLGDRPSGAIPKLKSQKESGHHAAGQDNTKLAGQMLKNIRNENKRPLAVDTAPVDEEKLRRTKIAILKERSLALVGQAKYLEAAPVLEEINSLEDGKELSTSLLMAECYLQLGREKKAEKAIKSVRKILMNNLAAEAKDVELLASDLTGNSCHARAVILLRIASDMYKTNSPHPDAGIGSCINKTDNATRPMIRAGGRARVIGIDFGIEYMLEMLEDLRDVGDHSQPKTVLKVAQCSNYVAFNYALANENEKSIKLRQGAVDELEGHFGPTVTNHKLYGTLLHNLGVAHHNLNKYSEAANFYMKAIDAKESATDYKDDEEKQKDIQSSRNDLKNTRSKLSNAI